MDRRTVIKTRKPNSKMLKLPYFIKSAPVTADIFINNIHIHTPVSTVYPVKKLRKQVIIWYFDAT